MPFVTDSRYRGYLGPLPASTPLEDDAWTDFLHDVVAGVTGLDPTLVRPRWQPEPPVSPPATTNWAAIGITDTEADWNPAVIHFDDPTGLDALQRMETATLLCSFYGPSAQSYASLLRDGLFIDQNLALLRSENVVVVEVRGFVRTADIFKSEYRDRVDVPVIFRREIRRNYPVLSLLQPNVTVTAEQSGDLLFNDQPSQLNASEIATLDTISGLRYRLDSLSVSQSILQNSVDSLLNQLNGLAAQLAALTGTVANDEASAASLSSQLASLDASLTTLEQQVSALENP